MRAGISSNTTKGRSLGIKYRIVRVMIRPTTVPAITASPAFLVLFMMAINKNAIIIPLYPQEEKKIMIWSTKSTSEKS
ncbi:hypothetical protein [Halobacillus dabanensis]|uniref:hypothetical protein n=1 Tax=Halobacillus dabanensis TaxID=240302 RepID=UPI0009421105